MARLVIVVGESPAGELVNVYTGPCADAAHAAIAAAGAEGLITAAYVYRNPTPDRRVSFVKTQAEIQTEAVTAAQLARQTVERVAVEKQAAAVAATAVSMIEKAIVEAGKAPEPIPALVEEPQIPVVLIPAEEGPAVRPGAESSGESSEGLFEEPQAAKKKK
jgi:hypothetical protein